MQRRGLLGIGAAVCTGWALHGWAQPAPGVHAIGLLSGGTDPRINRNWAEFFSSMRGLGYEEGRNVSYDIRYADGSPDRLPQLARDVVAAKPRLIVTSGGAEAVAARQATAVIPIVMVQAGDPVGLGLAASLARPGGNVTGLTNRIPGFLEKALSLLCDAIPSAKRIGVLGNPDYPSYVEHRHELDRAAASRNVVLLPTAEARRPADLAAAFERLAQDRPQALMVLPDVLFFVRRREVIDFAAQSKLPAMYGFTEDAEAGGLMAFATVYRDLHSRAPVFVDRILKGANPAEMPIEQPTRFGLWLNLKTAKVLGITIPQSVLLRADRVID